MWLIKVHTSQEAPTSKSGSSSLEEYYSKLDDEHQLAHQYFIETLIDKYGVTEKSLHIIFESFLSGQFDKIFKNLAKLMENEKNFFCKRKKNKNIKSF